MEEDEDDDIYAPVEASGRSGAFQDAAETLNGSKNGVSKDAKSGEDLEDGEEEGEEVEEEESDSVLLEISVCFLGNAEVR